MDYRATDKGRLQAGFTELEVNIWPKAGSTDTTHGAAEAADWHHQLYLRSSLDLPGHLQFDATFRYISSIDNPNDAVPDYEELDLRLAWSPTPNLEISIVGQNLLHDYHFEFGNSVNRQGIERGVYGKVAWRF